MAAWLGASGWTLYVGYSGIEAPLVILFMGLSLLAAWRAAASPSPANGALLGLTMGLCFLARLDSFFFLGVLALLVLPALLGPTIVLLLYPVVARLLANMSGVGWGGGF